jgi:hypothetical protein
MGNCMRVALSSGCKSSGFNDAQETRWTTFRLFREFDRDVRLFSPWMQQFSAVGIYFRNYTISTLALVRNMVRRGRWNLFPRN